LDSTGLQKGLVAGSSKHGSIKDAVFLD